MEVGWFLDEEAQMQGPLTEKQPMYKMNHDGNIISRSLMEIMSNKQEKKEIKITSNQTTKQKIAHV